MPPDHASLGARHIAASARSPIAALGAFESRVEVWDVDAGRRLAGFETVLDFGGSRLALDADGSRVLAAGYDRRGVACYEARTGNAIWLRRDLTRVQHLSTAASGEVAFACADIRSCHVLSLHTGQTLETLRGVRAVYSSRHSEHRLLDRTKPVVDPGGSFDRESFAILDAAFAPRQMVVTEAGGLVRCFMLDPFREQWRWSSRPGRHVIAVDYHEASAEFVAVEYPYDEGGPFVLGSFAEDGSWNARAVVPPAPDVAFCRQGALLLLSDGRLIDTASASLVGMLPLEN